MNFKQYSSQFSFSHLENSTHAESLKVVFMLYIQDHNTLKYRKTKGKKQINCLKKNDFIQIMTVQLVNDLTIKTVHKVRSIM